MKRHMQRIMAELPAHISVEEERHCVETLASQLLDMMTNETDFEDTPDPSFSTDPVMMERLRCARACLCGRG